MEEEKYNVNILAADSVDSSGEPNFPQKGFQSFLHRMEIRPLLCLLCQSEGKNKTMPSFLFSPQGRWRIQGKDRKLQLLLNVLEWEVHPGTLWRPTGPNSTRLIEPNIHHSQVTFELFQVDQELGNQTPGPSCQISGTYLKAACKYIYQIFFFRENTP